MAGTTLIHRLSALHSKSSDESTLIRSPTQTVQRLLQRQSPGHRTPRDLADTAATLEVMLRVLPSPRLLLAVSRPELAQALKPVLQDVQFELVETTADKETLSLLTTTRCPITITDSLSLVTDLRAEYKGRFAHLVFLTADAKRGSAALRAGADDIVDVTAGMEQMRVRMHCARRLAVLEAGLRTALSQNRKLSTVDELTGVANRHFFTRIFPRELARAKHCCQALTLIMCDVDLFKRVNDTYGHPVGDAVLREFGVRLQSQLRRGIDWVARLGGEEFAIVMPESDSASGLAAARRLRECIRCEHFIVDHLFIKVTASFGLCTVNGKDLATLKGADQLLTIADKAMYQSKSQGRDRINIATLQQASAGAHGSSTAGRSKGDWDLNP